VAGQQAGAAQGREELLEELLGDVAALRQLLDRYRPISGSRELRQGDDGVADLEVMEIKKPFLPHRSGLG